jgi:hypothetical protein
LPGVLPVASELTTTRAAVPAIPATPTAAASQPTAGASPASRTAAARLSIATSPNGRQPSRSSPPPTNQPVAIPQSPNVAITRPRASGPRPNSSPARSVDSSVSPAVER